MKRSMLLFALVSLVLSEAHSTLAAEKLKFASAIRVTAAYYLPILAAEENGLWTKHGLEAEWVPFRTPGALHRAVVAGSVAVGADTAMIHIIAITRGVPTTIISNLQLSMPARLWVVVASPIRAVQDLKGARIAVDCLGCLAHAYVRMMLRHQGFDEKQVRFVGVGGIPEMMAALKSGAVQATGLFRFTMWPLEWKKEVRAIARLEGSMWEDELSHVVFARKDLVATRPQLVGQVVAAVLESVDHVVKNPAWAEQKISKEQGLPLEAARGLYQLLRFTSDGKVSRQALESNIKFLVEFGLIEKEKAPRPDDIYTGRFTG